MNNGVNEKIKRKKISTRIIIIIIITVVIGLIALAWLSVKRGKKLAYDTEKLEFGDITATVSSTGNLSAVTTVDVGSQVSGTIQEIFVDYNEKVHKGQVLARIDPSLYETQLEQAQAKLNIAKAQKDKALADYDKARIAVQNAQAGIYKAQAVVSQARAEIQNAKSKLASANAALRQAKAQMENDSAEYERAAELYKKELISRSEKEKAYTVYQVSKGAYDSARAGITSAAAAVDVAESGLKSAQSTLKAALAEREAQEAAVKAAKSGIEQANASIRQSEGDVASVKVNLDRCIIKSPIDGIVIDKKVEPGQTVAASFQTPVLFRLAKDLKKMEVKAAVDEADIGKVEEGQDVEFTVDAFPDDKFSGRIFQVRSSPTTDQNVVAYDVIIRTDNKDLKLKPGMTANIDITIGTKKNVLLVPNSALRFRPDRVPEFPFPEDVKKEMQRKERDKENGLTGKDKKNEPEKQTVWVLEKGKPVRYKFIAGLTNNVFTEMKSGDLRAGMEVIIDAMTAAEKAKREKERKPSSMRIRVGR